MNDDPIAQAATEPKQPDDPTIDPVTGQRYELHLVASSSELRHYRLAIPGEGRIQSTDIIVTGDYTVICGDLCPGRNGVVSTLGIGLGFLSHPRSPTYLAERFLPFGWYPALAHIHLDSFADFSEDPMFALDAVCELHGMIDDGDVRGLSDWFTKRGWGAEDVPGHGYEPSDLELLSLINRRFAALYAA